MKKAEETVSMMIERHDQGRLAARSGDGMFWAPEILCVGGRCLRAVPSEFTSSRVMSLL